MWPNSRKPWIKLMPSGKEAGLLVKVVTKVVMATMPTVTTATEIKKQLQDGSL